MPDVYTYDTIPAPLRVQIVHIWQDAIGSVQEYNQGDFIGVQAAYKFIVETLCREYGTFSLKKEQYAHTRHYMEELINWFLEEGETERALDAVELTFRWIDRMTRKYPYRRDQRCNEIADEAISELNSRLTAR